jgi:hypothetical protein
MSEVNLINEHIDGSETCVICGRDIPEGSQVCVICGKTEPRDMVEVVRCKDCKWVSKAYKSKMCSEEYLFIPAIMFDSAVFMENEIVKSVILNECICFCDYDLCNQKVKENHFCSYGERRGKE